MIEIKKTEKPLIKEGMGKWSDWYLLSEDVINGLKGEKGLYEIIIGNLYIPNYPYGTSPIIYIGTSKSLKRSLIQHIKNKKSRIYPFFKKYTLFWRYISVENLEDAKRRRLINFKKKYGDLPICNKKKLKMKKGGRNKVKKNKKQIGNVNCQL
ncbi:MAG: hypothetical protein QXO40_00150 [Candidatus Aenigmatarchaeota archaeon]